LRIVLILTNSSIERFEFNCPNWWVSCRNSESKVGDEILRVGEKVFVGLGEILLVLS